MRVILNGHERTLLGFMQREYSEVLRAGEVLEGLVLADVPFAVMEKLSGADKIEMQVGTDEFEFLPSQIDNLSQWVGRFPATQPQPEAAPKASPKPRRIRRPQT